MKTLVCLTFVAFTLIPLASANLQIAGVFLFAPYRLVITETCSIQPITTTVTGSAVQLFCINLSSGPPAGMTQVCGWSQTPNCRYQLCGVRELSSAGWGFKVSYLTPTVFTCNVDQDKAKFDSGVLLPTACCP